jgi:flagella basal body P-ring formation protein FlgA
VVLNPTKSGENVFYPVKRSAARRFHLLLLTIAAAIASTPAPGETHQDLTAIHEAVIDFVSAQQSADADLQVHPRTTNPRFRRTPCQSPLVAFATPGAKRIGNTTVGVRCDGKRPWKLYIPTRVTLMLPVVVANRPLLRGQRLAAKDLRIEKRDAGTVQHPAIRTPTQVVGYVVTHPIATGQAVDGAMLAAPNLVERDHRVRMTARNRGIDISVPGQAMEDSALGETVNVRNASSRAFVEGVVTGPGTARLRLHSRTIKTALKQ